ncbi:AAA family ATPase [Vibrio cyclitrophicus]|uniref:AAA family ATPase n=1 Tax=Vibrio cyclitrophicus TaxID=47951 RepID=UPI0007EEC75A|nr:AAA family ATPase [Vibrio cyclitrophicus]OBS91866.1 AAA family ATPase [Vibrio cyclitrophicus]
MKKQKLTYIRGVSGSGKTTKAHEQEGVLVEADMFFTSSEGEYKFDSRYIKDAHAWCQLEMKRLLLAGYDVVVANTFIKKWELMNYLKVAQSSGLDLEIEVLEAKGNYQNVHEVPGEVVERMRKQYEHFELKPMRSSDSDNLVVG